MDGVPCTLIQRYCSGGVMPELAKLIRAGRLYSTDSSLPEISSVAWTSAVTGANPGEHGIYGFTMLAPQSYTLTFPNFRNMKKAPFWLNEDFSPKTDGKYAILNVPFTFPARELNGVQIAGFVSLNLQDAVWPKKYLGTLAENNYSVDVDVHSGHESTSLFLRKLDETLTARIKVAEWIRKSDDWKVFMLVFTGTDRLSHFLFNAAEDEEHPNHAEFLNHFRRIDEYIGRIASEMQPEDTLALLSDHGFEPLKTEYFLNVYLRQRGYLEYRSDSPKSPNDMSEKTRVFAMDPGRLYINREGLFPRGKVTETEAEDLKEELKVEFRNLKHGDSPVVSEIYDGRKVYHGDYSGMAPDLILIGAGGVDLKGSVGGDTLTKKNVFNGKHTYHNAFFALKKPGNTDDYPEVPDVMSIRKALGL